MVYGTLLQLFLLLLPAVIFAQAQALHWFFGENAGLDFSTGAPVAVAGGKINSVEGVSSVTDTNGQLLFYTNGETVYTGRHTVMANGSGLAGSFSSSQSALIIPFVDDPNRYYVFTVVDEGKAAGLCYSVVSMVDTDEGYGIVEEKNIQMVTPVEEKLTAVQHCNGRDIWVITRGYLSDAYYSFLITGSGVNRQPVISRTGHIEGETRYDGCLKVSPDGNRIATAYRGGKLELCDFDNFSGVVSNPRDLSVNGAEWSYGVEFSPDSRFLYTAGWSPDFSRLFQFDVSADAAQAIIASQQIIAESSREIWGTLQVGPDQRIYLAVRHRPYLSLINFPSLPGQACSFRHGAVRLTGNSQLGLPASVQSYFDSGFGFSAQCGSRTANFFYKQPSHVTHFEWQFGDPVSGSNNISYDSHPQHIFSDFGKYTVMLIRIDHCARRDTGVREVSVGNVRLHLGSDTTLCEGSTLLLPAGPSDYAYTWQDGSRQPWYNIRDSGEYTVEMQYGTCIQTDTIRIAYRRMPSVSLGADVKLCASDSWDFTLTPEADFHYVWESGATALSRTIRTPGVYALTAYNSCGRFTDSIRIEKGQCAAYLPNAFSPNGDGRNDIFTVGGAHNVKEFEMQIYNRWGQRVYTGRDPLKGWNGIQQGRPASEGQYVCVVRYRDPETGNLLHLKGVFLLIR